MKRTDAVAEAVGDPLARDAPGLGAEAAQGERAPFEPEVAHHQQAEQKGRDQDQGAQHVRHPEVDLAEEAAGRRADKHEDAEHDPVASEDRLQAPLVAHRVEGVDHPGVDSAGVEGVADAEQGGGRDKGPDAVAGQAEAHVEERRDEDGADREQVRDAAADRVRDDAGGHLEHHLRDRVGGVDEHHLEDVETHREQEQGVDAPDQRLRERRRRGDAVVGADDALRVHGRSVPPAARSDAQRPLPGLRERAERPAAA